MLGQLSIPHYRVPLSPNPPAKGDKVGGRVECGENVTGAANQQERLEPQWVVGFVDGEGCFHIALNRQPKMRSGWQVLPEFRVVQHERDEQVLVRLQQFFGCGCVTINNGDRKELRVRGMRDLKRISEFFKVYRLQSKKRRDFGLFASVLELMERGEHLSPGGLRTVASIALEMNTRTNTEASRILRDWMSTSPKGEGTVRPSQRCEEAVGNHGPPSAGKVIEATE